MGGGLGEVPGGLQSNIPPLPNSVLVTVDPFLNPKTQNHVNQHPKLKTSNPAPDPKP